MSYLVWSSVNNFGTATSSPVLAAFRATCQEFHDKLVEAGFVWSTKAVAAQVDFATCGTPSQVMGSGVPSGSLALFRIYELADSLQATYPLYIKIHFNGITNYGQQPFFPIQVGTTCDDITGVLGGLVTEVMYPCASHGYSNVGGRANSAQSCAGIGDGFAWVSYNRSNNQMASSIARPSLFFILERITDASGNPIAGGFHLVMPTGSDSVSSATLQHRTLTESYDSGWGTKNCRIVAGYTAIASNGAIQFQRMFMLTPHARPMRSVLLCYSTQVTALMTTELELVSGQAPVNFLAMGTGQGPCGSSADANFTAMQLCLRT